MVYRESARFEARRDDVVARATAAIAMPYGGLRAIELRAALARPIDESSLDELESATAVCFDHAERIGQLARRFAVLGAPPASAELGLSDPLDWDTAAASVLREKVAHWTRDVRGETLIAGRPLGATVYFEEEGRPCRLEIEAIRFTDEAGYSTTSSLMGMARTRATLAVRPQTFGDDLLATLRLRRDVTFDDPDFDGMYFVSGDEAELRAFFTAEVRAAFVAATRAEVAEVNLGGGVAQLMNLQYQSLTGACALLAALAPP